MRGYWKAIVVLGTCAVLLALSYVWVVRWDLTDDKHYSLSEASKTMLKQTDAPIHVTLFLDGDLNAGFRRLKRATEETLEEFRRGKPCGGKDDVLLRAGGQGSALPGQPPVRAHSEDALGRHGGKPRRLPGH